MRDVKTFIVTGGAGFIGSALVRLVIAETPHRVIVLDKLTYAGNLDNLAPIAKDPRFSFANLDICDAEGVRALIGRVQPDAIIHLAAESHVDRSIDGPGDFIRTNIEGTFTLLQAALGHWRGLDADKRNAFRFHHISTDEVFGSLGAEGLFTETTPYDPRSPYSASKAASDHLVMAWHHTYGLPVLLSNCSNNYGPYHFPEKLIPLVTLNALEGKPLPVYGKGDNIRDWLYVEDHARALLLIATTGIPGESYAIGGRNERTNIDVVRSICSLMDEMRPGNVAGGHQSLISFVADRPGHDQRYAIDAAKIERELGWRARETFDTGLRKTVAWYLDNPAWWGRIRSGVYKGQRLGVATGTLAAGTSG